MDISLVEANLAPSANTKQSTSQRVSAVWNYFEKVQDLNKAKCRVCYALLSTGTGKGKSSTSALRNHLNFKHYAIYNEMVKSEPKKNLEQPFMENVQSTEISVSECSQQSEIWDLTGHNANADYSVSEVVILGDEPTSLDTYEFPITDQNCGVITQTHPIETNCKEPQKSSRLSAVWAYFDLMEDLSKAKCRLCGTILSRGKIKCATSSLRNHLQYKHIEEYKTMLGTEGKIKNISKLKHLQSCHFDETMEINDESSEDNSGNAKDVVIANWQSEVSDKIYKDQYTIASLSRVHNSEDTSTLESNILLHKPFSLLGSAVWKYFDQTEDKRQAICRLCGSVLSQGQRQKGTTSSLRNHLKFKHAGEYKDMIKYEGKNIHESLRKKSFPPRRFLKVFHNNTKVVRSRNHILKAKNALKKQNSMELVMKGESRQYTSAVWHFFIKFLDDPSKAQCKLCDTSISTGSVLNLQNHLMVKHILEYKAILDSEKSCSINQPAFKTGEYEQLSAEANTIWDISDNRSVQLHKVIAEMIVLDNQNFNILENYGFKRVLQVAQPHYKIPDQLYFIEKIVPDMYVRLKQQMKIKISEAISVSISCATWTFTESNYRLALYIGHWISPDFDLCHSTLTIKSVPGRSNAAFDFSNVSKELIYEWNLDKKVHLFVINDSTTIANEINEDSKSITCFLQSLQSVIKDSIDGHTAVNGVISRARHFIDYFMKSPVAYQRLSEFRNDLHFPEVKLPLSDGQKWISTYYMLLSLHKNKKGLFLYCSEENETFITIDDWNIIESMLSVLQPFVELTKQINNSKSLASEIIPAVMTLQRFLSKEKDGHHSVLELKDAICNRLTEQFHDIDMDENLCFATCVDPRFKLAFFKKDLHGHLKNLLFQKITASPQFSLLLKSSCHEKSSSQLTETSQEIGASFWDCFEEVAQENYFNENSPNSQEHYIKLLNSEMNMFFSIPLLEHDKNPLHWWKENQFVFPNLVKCVFKYLSAPSTVYEKTNFSDLCRMYEENCTNMKPEITENLLFIHQNLRNFISDY